MNFRESLAAYVLGNVTGDELPRICADALLEGYESSSLAALAGESPRMYNSFEFSELLRAALSDLRISLPSRAEAGRILVRHYVSAVAAGLLAVRDGAARIVRVQQQVDADVPSRHFVGDGLGVEQIIGLYYSHDDCSSGATAEHDEIDRAIVEECRRIASHSAG